MYIYIYIYIYKGVSGLFRDMVCSTITNPAPHGQLQDRHGDTRLDVTRRSLLTIKRSMLKVVA